MVNKFWSELFFLVLALFNNNISADVKISAMNIGAM